jgi:hypothetical protein
MSTPAEQRVALETTRGAIAKLQADLASIDDAPLPKSDWRARTNAWIDDQAEKFEQDAWNGINALRSPGPAPDRPAIACNVITTASAVSKAHPAGADVTGALAWLLRDQLKQRLATVIDSRDYEEGLPLADRPKAKADTEAQLRAAEISEEQTVRSLEALTGQYEPRRADADPALVLAFDDALTPEPKRRASK